MVGFPFDDHDWGGGTPTEQDKPRWKHTFGCGPIPTKNLAGLLTILHHKPRYTTLVSQETYQWRCTFGEWLRPFVQQTLTFEVVVRGGYPFHRQKVRNLEQPRKNEGTGTTRGIHISSKKNSVSLVNKTTATTGFDLIRLSS